MNSLTNYKEEAQKYLEKTSNRMNVMKPRERALIFACALVVFYMTWNWLVNSVIFAGDETQVSAMDKVKQDIDTLNTQITTIINNVTQDKTALENLNNLKGETDSLRKQIFALTKDMVSPQDMERIVRELIAKTQGLTILNLESIASIPLFVEPEKNQIATVYNHGLKLVVEGDFFNILNFLESLESQHLKMIWDELDYEVEKYPKATVTLILHTIGSGEGWIGV
jgi:MSHA biogenesis protein MshJ